jgi:hypothetical protein
VRPATTATAVLAALLLTGCSNGTSGTSSNALAVGYAVAGCRDFVADDKILDHLEPITVHGVFVDVRDSKGALQRAAELDSDWVPLSYNARIVIDALGKADVAVDAGRDPVWTEDRTIDAAVSTVRAECARARSEAAAVPG